MKHWMAFVAVAAVSFNALADLGISYDRFTGRTTITAPKPFPGTIPSAGFEVQALTVFDGEKPRKLPASVVLSFKALSFDGWRYLKCHSVAALANGKPFALPPSKHDGGALGGSEVLESIYIDIPWAVFSALSRAERLEFRVCNTEAKLSDDRIEEFRALVRAASPSRS
jgi:hypothetical protein